MNIFRNKQPSVKLGGRTFGVDSKDIAKTTDVIKFLNTGKPQQAVAGNLSSWFELFGELAKGAPLMTNNAAKQKILDSTPSEANTTRFVLFINAYEVENARSISHIVNTTTEVEPLDSEICMKNLANMIASIYSVEEQKQLPVLENTATVEAVHLARLYLLSCPEFPFITPPPNPPSPPITHPDTQVGGGRSARRKPPPDAGEEAVLFVFYELVADARGRPPTWRYTKMAKGWDWVGAGGTKKPDYPSEEQFGGPAAGRTAARAYLQETFAALKAAGKVKRFKVRAKYAP